MQCSSNAILCESVRREHDGKHTLVGAVVGGLETDQNEFDEKLSLFASFDDLPQGAHKLCLRLTPPSKHPQVTQYTLQVDDSDQAILLVISGIPFKTSNSGFFIFHYQFDGEKRWRKLISLEITLSQVESA